MHPLTQWRLFLQGVNYIGNGTNDKWATFCRGKKWLFCRASGCGKEMERCCYVKMIAGPLGYHFRF